VKFDPQHPVDSAYGLNDPAGAMAALNAAAEECKKAYGSLDIAWGDVNRYLSGNADLPGDGAAAGSACSAPSISAEVGNKNYATHGETFVCGIEFAEKQNAQCALSYGNFSQPGSSIWRSTSANGGEETASGLARTQGNRS